MNFPLSYKTLINHHTEDEYHQNCIEVKKKVALLEDILSTHGILGQLHIGTAKSHLSLNMVIIKVYHVPLITYGVQKRDSAKKKS